MSSAKKIGSKVVAFAAPAFVKDDSFAYDINNEFNGVEVTGLFADKQVFTGKGAGSFPTASAVLSDVSALLFDYQYEYKKSLSNLLSLAEDFVLKAFVSSKNQKDLEALTFIELEEEFTSLNYSYKVGRININEFSHQLYRENPNIFISFFEDAKVEVLDELVVEQENVEV